MLDNGGQTRDTLNISRSAGFGIRGASAGMTAVVSRIPDGLEGAEVSVCGVKGFMVDETRVFTDEAGEEHTIACAKVACLEIIDSPVHVHGETLETYHILEGNGRMILDDKVEVVSAGSLVVLPPGVQHGLMSDNPDKPMKVLMTFTPGLAPVQHQAFRDEKIICTKASEMIVD